MELNILIASTPLMRAFNTQIPAGTASSDRLAMNKVGEVFKEFSGCKIWASSQAINKVCDTVTGSHAVKLRELILEETATRGVASFTPESSTVESAKRLSLSGMTLVISSCSADKEMSCSRIAVLTPEEWVKLHGDVCKVHRFLGLLKPLNMGLPESEFIELIWAACEARPQFLTLVEIIPDDEGALGVLAEQMAATHRTNGSQ